MQHSTIPNIKAALLAAAAIAAFSVPALPAAAQTQNLPSYATTDEAIHGRVASVNDKYHLTVRDDRGFIDDISLHDGTVINPTGLTLAVGESVTIHGHANGSTFLANEIDTPYESYGVPYTYYPYPVYGFGYGFGFRDRGFGFRGRF